MRATSWPRRALTTLAVTAAAAGAVTVAAAPAMAVTSKYLPQTTFAVADSRVPDTTITTGDAVVGTHVHGLGVHTSKTYFTIDVSGALGTTVFEAKLSLREESVNDCSVPRATEVWLTETLTSGPTWANQPAELTRLSGPAPQDGCLAPYDLEWDATDVLRDAVAAGRDTVTVVVRTAAEHEGDVAYGRTYGGYTGINAKINTAPDLPTNVRLGTWLSQAACGEEELVVSFADWNPLTVYADVSDPDDTQGLVARAVFWPIGDPAARRDVTETVYSSWTQVVAPQELFVDGGAYVMRLRTEDTDGAASPWTSPCRFTVDQTGS